MHNFYKSHKTSALDAISDAQKIINGPVLFQTVYTLIEHNVLQVLSKEPDGLSICDLEKKTDLSAYALNMLLKMAASGTIVTVSDDEIYKITKTGLFLINDEMTRINLNFIKHICYAAMDHLDESVTQGKPAGLGVFNNDWETIYPHLVELPPKAKEAWFGWDHLYSQTSFKPALKVLKEKYSPSLIYDVGGNTGKFAIECCRTIENTKVKILDLPSQVKTARENIAAHGLSDRIDFLECDILLDTVLPKDADIWWLSQFLDCFAHEHVISILRGIRNAMKDGAYVCILEPVADRQKFEAASYSINAGSLYFTAVANGYSGFFSTKDLTSLIEKAGLKVVEIIDELGISNSMFICEKN